MPDPPLPSVLLLTDRTLLTANWALAQAVAPCITGGATMVVFRESELPDNPRLVLARFVKDGVVGRVPFIVSGQPEFALKAGADGLLVENQEESISRARELLGPDRTIGAIVSTMDRLKAAQSEGADFALIIADWSNAGSALDVLLHYCESATIPIIAGVDMSAAQAGQCIAAGASGVAICSVGMASYDRTGAVREYAEVLLASRAELR